MASPANATRIDIGTVLDGRYEVTHLLGKGGMGAVWGAKHLRLKGKQVAIKVLHDEVMTDNESVMRFQREAQIASQLGHANIIKVEDINQHSDGTPYIVLEFLKGESLADRLARGALPVDQTLAIVRQVGSGLAAAHAENIIHRDLKPQNVFLCPTESSGYATEQAKVLDFGISKIRGSTTVKTQTASMLGTPQYMAPEQATGNHDTVDARTDVFALGVMIYEMLSGTEPFRGNSIPEVVFKVVYEEPPSLGELVPSLDPTLVAAVQKAMAKQQDQRFPDVSSFVEALTGDPLTTLRSGTAVAPVNRKPLPPSVNTGAHRPSHVQEAYAATAAPGTPVPASQAMGAVTPMGSAVMAASTDPNVANAATMLPGQPAAMSTPHPAGQHGATPYPAGQHGAMHTPAAAGANPVTLQPVVTSPEFATPPPHAANMPMPGAGHAKKPRSRGWIIAVGLVAAAAAAGITYGAIKNISSDGDTTAVASATPSDAGATAQSPTPPIEPVTPPETPIDANNGKSPTVEPNDPNNGNGNDVAGKDNNGKKTNKPATGATGKSSKLDPEVKKLLDEAKKALKKKDLRGALSKARKAQRISNSRAVHNVLLEIYCKQGNLEMANISARKVSRSVRRKMALFCDKHGYDIR